MYIYIFIHIYVYIYIYTYIYIYRKCTNLSHSLSHRAVFVLGEGAHGPRERQAPVDPDEVVRDLLLRHQKPTPGKYVSVGPSIRHSARLFEGGAISWSIYSKGRLQWIQMK